jgi:hypothetical protein
MLKTPTTWMDKLLDDLDYIPHMFHKIDVRFFKTTYMNEEVSNYHSRSGMGLDWGFTARL